MSTHSTMTRSLTELANHLVDLRIERVVMEATSDYWKPVFYLLEAHGLEPCCSGGKTLPRLSLLLFAFLILAQSGYRYYTTRGSQSRHIRIICPVVHCWLHCSNKACE
ncbi:hypothetical protein [Arthrobacter sp. Soil736]|uniref:hypothetical protein n=1 Tax=Arthrobacter sp. Soil736 TaxID=1736395 RepID=UPI00190FDDFA|nr:hypothetical protein [Arthrobacter sp. Soil736]